MDSSPAQEASGARQPASSDGMRRKGGGGRGTETVEGGARMSMVCDSSGHGDGEGDAPGCEGGRGGAVPRKLPGGGRRGAAQPATCEKGRWGGRDMGGRARFRKAAGRGSRGRQGEKGWGF